MAKRTHTEVVATEAQVVATEPTTEPTTSAYGTIAEAQMADPKALGAKTVVKRQYKRAYIERARAAGHKDRASRRGNGDWLQREIQAETIGKDGSFDLDRFVEILEANGIGSDVYGAWKREKPSDIGRFRMSGSIVLRGRIGKSGVLLSPDGGATNVVELAEQGDELAKAFVERWAN